MLPSLRFEITQYHSWFVCPWRNTQFLYCGGKLNKRGEFITLGGLRENYCSYKDTRAIENNMKDYKNFINPVLLNEPDKKLVLEVVQTSLAIEYCNQHRKYHDSSAISSNLVYRERDFLALHGYNGRGVDRKHSSKLLNKLNELDV